LFFFAGMPKPRMPHGPPLHRRFNPLTKSLEKWKLLWTRALFPAKKISYGLGGLGVVGMSALAFFGRFNWNWLWGLMGGLMLVGLYGTGVTAFTGDTF